MNKIDLNGKNAVVTGAGRGIGLAIVERLLASGARCSLWDANAESLAGAAKALEGKGKFHTQVVDVSDFDEVHKTALAASSHLGSIELLVNNAGIAGVTKKMWECTPDEWRLVINVNLLSVFYCCHAIVPLMMKKGYGRIVNIASIAGKEGNPNASHYSTAKAGVIALTKSLGKELAQTGILVNCITPAVIQTDILKQVPQGHIDYMLSRIPMGRFGNREEAAAMVAWLCSDDCSFSTGAVFDLSGGRATY